MENENPWPAGDELTDLPALHGQGASEFLAQEYEHLYQSFLDNERSGDRRLAAFLSVLGAVAASVAIYAGNVLRTANEITGAAIVGCVVAGVFGLATLRRLLRRDVATTEYLKSLKLIRAARIQTTPELAELLPFIPGRAPELRTLERGSFGYSEFVAVINSLVGALAVVLLGTFVGYVLAGAVTGIVTLGALWYAQRRWSNTVYMTETQEAWRKRSEALAWWRQALLRFSW